MNARAGRCVCPFLRGQASVTFAAELPARTGVQLLRGRRPMLRMKVALMMALAVFGAAACSSKTTGALPDDMDLGNAQSKVTVVEYASVGCPVCAKWYREVYPAFKTKYIDTGKVHYVFREMLVGGGPEIAVAASGFLVARCAGKDKYF